MRFQACKPSFPLQIVIDTSDLQKIEAEHLVHLTQHALDDLNEFSPHHLRLGLANTIQPLGQINPSASVTETGANDQTIRECQVWQRTEDEVLNVRLNIDNKATVIESQLDRYLNVLDIVCPANLVPVISSSSSLLASYIATRLQELYEEEQAIIEYVLTSVHASKNQAIQQSGYTTREAKLRQNKSFHPELASKLTNRLKRSIKYAPIYHLTISLFTPTTSPSDWEIEAAIAEYLSPLLASLSVISNFTVDTQIQLHAKFAPSMRLPEFDEEARVWTLREEDLSSFINSAEWPLSPSTGAGTTLNFILYVPDPATSPLLVKGSHASSWLIPQWGGVAILNPVDTNQTSTVNFLRKEALQPALLTFSHQLLFFLGAPQAPSSLPLQLQTLVRVRVASLLLSASSTMGSLARLTVALPSIAIPETVSLSVDITLTHLRKTCAALKEGRFKDALEHARIAEAHAERGFFEKSMVGQVYFPDEHKVAVYLPLLGPIGVPLVMSVLKEIKRIAAARKARRTPR